MVAALVARDALPALVAGGSATGARPRPGTSAGTAAAGAAGGGGGGDVGRCLVRRSRHGDPYCLRRIRRHAIGVAPRADYGHSDRSAMAMARDAGRTVAARDGDASGRCAARMARDTRSDARGRTDRRCRATCAVCRAGARARLRRCPALRRSDVIVSPQVTGLWRPVVLLPAEHTLDAHECAMALAHELAHLRRGDLWLGWIPALAQRAFFFHPLARWAMREYASIAKRPAMCRYSTAPAPNRRTTAVCWYAWASPAR